MKKNKLILSVLMAGCLQAFTPASAQEHAVTMTTEKPAGSALTFMVNRANGVTVDWGDGAQVSYPKGDGEVIVIEGVTKGSKLVLKTTTNLELLSCSDCGLTAIDLSAAPELRSLYCQNNKLTTLNLKPVAKLTDLNCANNEVAFSSSLLSEKIVPKLETVNISNNKGAGTFKVASSTLQQVNISDNGFTSITVTQNPMLDVLNCENNNIKSLYLTGSPQVSVLMGSGNENFATLRVPADGLPEMRQVLLNDCKVKEMDLSASEKLMNVSCRNNNMKSLLLPSEKLLSLDCSGNNLSFCHFPSATNKPEYFSYIPQGVLTVTEKMQEYEGTPYMDICPSWTERDNEDYVLDLETYRYDGGGSAVTVSMKWYSVAVDGTKTELVAAKSTDRDQDFYNSKFKFSFFKGHSLVYGELHSKAYPDLVIKTDMFAVGKENALVGIEDVTTEENGLQLDVNRGTLTMSCAEPTSVNVYTTDGKMVWKGIVNASSTTINLPKGVYLVNGKKVLL